MIDAGTKGWLAALSDAYHAKGLDEHTRSKLMEILTWLGAPEQATPTLEVLPRYDIVDGRPTLTADGDYLIFEQARRTLCNLTNPAGAEAPVEQVKRATTIAFASTNDVGDVAGHKYWFGKGYQHGFAAQPVVRGQS